MALHENSVLSVIVIPAIGGVVGLFVFGPFGFWLGIGLPLVIGFYIHDADEAKDERIAELEQRVKELESENDVAE